MLAPLHPALYRRFAAGLFAVALVISSWALTRYWNESLRDGHEGRQQQTALTAYYFKKDGLKLAYETPILGPPWSIPMEFPLYQAIVAKLSAATGYPLEQTGRLVSVFFFYAALPALWLLLRRRMPAPPDALLVLAFVLVCPLYLFYSRTFMIESTALCLSLWFLVALDRCLAKPWGWALPAAWLLGALAAATKITTFVAAGSGAAILLLEQVLARRRAGASWNRAALQTGGAAFLALVVPLAAGVLWVRFSDDLKQANPFGVMITSHGLREFIWGTLAQRFSGEWWGKIITNHLTIIAALPGLTVLAVGPWLVERRYRRAAGACLLCYAVGHLFFANLYYVHDYYPYASAFFLLVAIGLVVAGLLRQPGFPGIVAVLLALGVFAGELYAFRTSYYRFYQRPNEAEPVETAIMRAITPPEDVIAVFGYDWNPVWPYYSQRRAIVPPLAFFENFAALDASLKNLGPRRLAVMGIARANREDSRFNGALVAKLQLCTQPIARTALMDIYVRKDLAAAAVRALSAREYRNAEINSTPDPGVVLLGDERDFTRVPWLDTLAGFEPRPFLTKGPVPVNYLDDPDNPENLAARRLLTQVPAEIHFHPPAGSRSISAAAGLLPSAYTTPNATAGMRVVVFEELPDGTRRLLFERLLLPMTEPKDRGDVAVDYAQEQPFTGTLVFAHYPVPSGSVAFGWGYWRRIVIR